MVCIRIKKKKNSTPQVFANSGLDPNLTGTVPVPTYSVLISLNLNLFLYIGILGTGTKPKGTVPRDFRPFLSTPLAAEQWVKNKFPSVFAKIFGF